MTWQALGVLILAAAGGAAQHEISDRDAVRQYLTGIKASLLKNEAKLRRYKWTESTQISVKGKAKSVEQSECHYGSDGQLVKTPVGARPAADTKLAGDLDRIRSLLRRYVPPDPQAMQDAFRQGKAAVNMDSHELTFTDYAKPGDRVTVAFDPATGNIRSYDATTFLDEPGDIVTLHAQFARLPDGTNYLEDYELDARRKEIRIKTSNFGHSK